MKHTGTVTLETERLILRRFTADDAPAMFANWAADKEVTRYLPWREYEREEDVKKYLEDLTARYCSEKFYDWCIVPKETGEPIGSAGAVRVDDELSTIGIGYCIGRKYWGHGIVPEAVHAMLKHFFEILGAVRVTGSHFAENPKSGRVLLKCGMKEEGLLRKSTKDNRGNFVDVKVYSVTDDDYFLKIR